MYSVASPGCPSCVFAGASLPGCVMRLSIYTLFAIVVSLSAVTAFAHDPACSIVSPSANPSEISVFTTTCAAVDSRFEPTLIS